MPRKANEKTELEIKKNISSKTASAKKTTKASSTKVKAETKAVTKKTSAKKETVKKDTKRTGSSTKKATTSKKTSATTKKATEKKKNKSSVAKKTTTRARKVATKKSAVVNEKPEKVFTPEYYDLPQKYNKTVVKLLAQTPKTLFIYWEISDDDIKKYKEQYGENFFETTKPVLIIHNDTLNYSFEVEINDFANSWYLHVNDSKSDYRVELGRRPIQYNEAIRNNYVYISSSNEIESPNDHILFDKLQKMVYFRNVKTNKEYAKPITTLTFIQNIGKIYDIYDLYQELYNGEENIERISNPSSNMSSQFK